MTVLTVYRQTRLRQPCGQLPADDACPFRTRQALTR
jgi:hypothetical protein